MISTEKLMPNCPIFKYDTEVLKMQTRGEQSTELIFTLVWSEVGGLLQQFSTLFLDTEWLK